MENNKREMMVCQCESLDHQVSFWYDEEDGLLYCEPHLTTHRNFIQRLWFGLKYAFGYKSRYGAWDSTMFKDEDLNKLITHLNINKGDISGGHEKLISEQQLKLSECESTNKNTKKIKKQLHLKFYAIGEPLNDNILKFNKEQIRWCFEVMELINKL